MILHTFSSPIVSPLCPLGPAGPCSIKKCVHNFIGSDVFDETNTCTQECVHA